MVIQVEECNAFEDFRALNKPIKPLCKALFYLPHNLTQLNPFVSTCAQDGQIKVRGLSLLPLSQEKPQAAKTVTVVQWEALRYQLVPLPSHELLNYVGFTGTSPMKQAKRYCSSSCAPLCQRFVVRAKGSWAIWFYGSQKGFLPEGFCGTLESLSSVLAFWFSQAEQHFFLQWLSR